MSRSMIATFWGHHNGDAQGNGQVFNPGQSQVIGMGDFRLTTRPLNS